MNTIYETKAEISEERARKNNKWVMPWECEPELRFEDGMPKRSYISTPQDYKGRFCKECVRLAENNRKKSGYRCSWIRNRNKEIHPDAEACARFWDKEKQDRLNRMHDRDVDDRRKQLWNIYAARPPVKLLIVDDGYGVVPKCPICGEMPYSTKQCHWCGQHFIQDDDVKEYSEPAPEEHIDCPVCGGKGTLIGQRSKYNGHFHGKCTKCGGTILS